MSSQTARAPYFRAGETIPESGVYSVYHASHRTSHDVVLLRGQEFPRCTECGDRVHFELVQSASYIEADENFRKRKLFEIPHPDETKTA